MLGWHHVQLLRGRRPGMVDHGVYYGAVGGTTPSTAVTRVRGQMCCFLQTSSLLPAIRVHNHATELAKCDEQIQDKWRRTPHTTNASTTAISLRKKEQYLGQMRMVRRAIHAILRACWLSFQTSTPKRGKGPNPDVGYSAGGWYSSSW